MTAAAYFRNDAQRAPSLLLPHNARVRQFHQSLPNYATTPLVALPALAQELGVGHLLVKDESSRLGLPAFKMLSASYATMRVLAARLGLEAECSLQALALATRSTGLTLYATTDGNYGRALARMAGYLNLRAKIYVPSELDEEAKSKIRGEGAQVVVFDGDYDQTVFETKLAAEQHPDGLGVLISDTALDIDDTTAQFIIEGYQTMFDEIEDQVADITGQRNITHVVTPVGVGSLAHAAVLHFRRRSPSPMMIAVEPTNAACLKASLEAGQTTSVKTAHTICSGMCCGTLSATAWPVLKGGIDIAVVVNDEEVVDSMSELETYDVFAGPCGAASLAGLKKLLCHKGFNPHAEDVVIILCTEGRRGYRLIADAASHMAGHSKELD